MYYDYRNGSVLFKHSFDEKPSILHESFREHYHTAYEVLYFLRGDAEFIIQHSSYALPSHSLLVIKPGEYHNLIMHTRQPYERIVIRFEETDLPPALRERLPSIRNVYRIKNTPVSRELLRIDEYVQEADRDILPALLVGQLHVILSFLCCCRQENSVVENRVNAEMRKTIDFIGSHLENIQSIDDICAGMHTSRSSLQKMFSSQLESPVMSYVRTQQCIAANELILEGMSASDAACRFGFEHYSTFYRAYTKVFHRPPSASHQRK